MAWRIHEHVLRGEIDNRTRGHIAGRIWLAGVDTPLVLELRGDGHPDLAGCLLRFENPAPVPLTTRPPAAIQRGTAGDITAARKVRVYDIPVADAYRMLKCGEKPPKHLTNCLYLEWFSALSGRMLIESTDYRLDISEPAWRFTAEELAERERRLAEGSDAFALEVHTDGTVEEWDEFRHEQFLRESEATGEKYRRLLEKYANHPDAEKLIAHEMGWEWFDEPPDPDQADDIAEMNAICEAALDEEEDLPDPAWEGIDWVHDKHERIVHPLYQRARDALDTLFDELRAAGQLPDCKDPALAEFIEHSMILTAKLAGATGGLARGFALDSGHTIALLKRTFEIHNAAIAAADRFTGTPFLSFARFAHHRAELFTLREAILALIARVRG